MMVGVPGGAQETPVMILVCMFCVVICMFFVFEFLTNK